MTLDIRSSSADGLLSAEQHANQRLESTPWGSARVVRVAYAHAVRLASGVARLGISANAITLTALGLAAGSGVAASLGHLGGAAALLLVSGALDILDGIVARVSKTSSAAGALLDSLCDRLSDAAPLLGLSLLLTTPLRIVALLALIFSLSISYVRARAEALGVTLPALWMRRPERVLLLVAALVLGAVFAPRVEPLGAALLVLAVACAGATLHALIAARRLLSSR